MRRRRNRQPPLQRYFNDLETDYADNTIQNRKVALRQFFEWVYVQDIEDITEFRPKQIHIETQDIEDFRRDLLEMGYAPRSIQDKLYALSHFCKYCEKRDIGHIDVDITNTKADDLTGNVIDSKTEKRYIEKNEFEEIRNSARNIRDELLIQLLWDTGVRASEAVKIKIDDINFEEQKIRVQNAKEQKNKEQTVRLVYYSKRLSLLLRRWVNNGHRESYMYTGSKDDNGHLLVTNQSPRMAVNRVNEIVKETIERSSVDNEVLYEDISGSERYKYTSHAFRHSFAVHRVKNGCPIIYLRDMLNHSTIEQTEDYLKFRDDDIKNAYQKYGP